ncbi:MAG: hypothetical protein HY913_13620 [Desulfomonile tiedjei]|nr:hypothetical protein [Desulfomonile tiedjei]
MKTAPNNNCAACDAEFREGAPFCTDCGKLSPAVLSEGDLAIEIDDVPAERFRSEAVSLLKAWFPQLDAIRAAERLKSGRATLIVGIDEASADRILQALEAIKVRGRVKSLKEKPAWLRWIWNPGLAVSAVSLALAALFGGWFALLMVILAVGAPAAVGLLKDRGVEPLVSGVRLGGQSEHWVRIAEEYSRVISQLSPQDSEALRTLVQTVFRLQRRLRSESLASVAAGFDRGDLYQRLSDALSSGVELSRRVLAEQEENKGPLREEIARLNELAGRTAEWFRGLDGPVIKSASILEAELSGISESIDRIVREVRPLPEVRLTNKGKVPL